MELLERMQTTLARNPAPGSAAAALVVATGAALLTRAGAVDAGALSLLLVLGAGVLLVAAFDPTAIARAFGRPMALLLAVSAALGVLSLAWTIAPARATLLASALPAIYLLSFVLGWTVGEWRRAARVAAIAMCAATTVICAGALLAWVWRVEPWAISIYGEWFPSGPFEYPPALAVLAAAAIPGAAIEARRAIKASSRLLAAAWVLALGLQLMVIVASESRFAVALLAIWVLAAVLRRWVPRPIPLRRLGLTALCVVVASFALLTAFSTPSFNHRVTHDRVDSWRVALRTTARVPAQGAGLGSFRVAVRENLRPSYKPRFAHSLPMDWAVELGWLGLLLGAALLACAGWIALAGAFSIQDGGSLAPFLGAFVLSNLIDWTWYLPLAGLFALGAAGIIDRRLAEH